ncbi:peptidase S8 [Neobacillus notoginsengisoli]|uniref:Peptidase S8 n=1 Tax=Neobacillus notoginsengisoli TaxID=1578198 RepID=A0A417YRS0_9BACI|nr:Ig-like domain-containing protein [Neobacillus notoginsengisoli]RHW37363.1 peptidase S8 [Neobacillus notoginsengisoli]
MNKRVLGKFATLVLIFSLFVSMFQPFAARAGSILLDEPIQLEKGQMIEGEFNQPGQVQWYKVAPSQGEIAKDTHMRIKLKGSFEGSVSVYTNSDRAQKDETFDAYRAYISSGEPAQIDMPLAWTGPYYIKVEFYGGYYDEMGIDPETGEPYEPFNATYQIGYEGVNLPPGAITGEACPVELSTKNKTSGAEILSQLRSVRNNLLSKTEQGKQLSSLYYKMTPFLVTKMVLDKNIRETVYKDLVQLKPLFKDVAANSDQSSYRFTPDDQKAINELYEIVLKNVPEHVKVEIEKKAKEIGLLKLADQKVADVLKKSNLAFSNSDPDRIIVKLKNGKTVSGIQQKAKSLGLSAASLKSNDPVLGNTVVLKANGNVQALANHFAKMPDVEYAEPVHKYQKQSVDIQYRHQWSLENTGQEFGKSGADINYSKLQQLVNSNSSNLKEVLIAVVDTGVDDTLADFEGKISSEGYDFVNRDKDPYDDEGHGTHVTGIIAAAADNNYSIAGINQKAKILPVKVLDASGSGDSDQIALGIKYAVDHGAKVINLSLGGAKSRVIEDMLKFAASKNVTVVAATGNDGSMDVSYPASSDKTIAVGATGRLDIVSDYSNYGEGLDIVAPGTEIPSLLPDGSVTFLSGTSMAAPHVSAVAGLLLAQNPRLTPDDIKTILTNTADNVAVEDTNNSNEYFDPEFPYPISPTKPGYDNASGWGRLNAWSAVSAVRLNLTVNNLTDNDKKVTGTATKGTQIEVRNGDTLLGKGTSAADGKFSVTIKPQMVNQVLHFVAKNGKSESTVKIIVKDSPIPETPFVNPVSNLDEVVTGEAAAGTTVRVNSKSTVLGAAETDANGHFKVQIKKQKEETPLLVTATSVSGKESIAANVIVLDKIPPAAPKVAAVSERDQALTGTTEANASVTVKNNGKTIGEAKADTKGKFKVAIKKQKAGTVLTLTAKDAAGNISKAVKVVVMDKTPPAAPKVNAVTDQQKAVTGKTEANATVTVKTNGKTIGEGKADAKGNFKIAIKKQKAGTALALTAKDAAGNISKAVKVVVMDKTPPAAPKVNAVTNQQKAVTGKTEANATVTVKTNGKTIGEGKADAKGNFKIAIKKQKAGTVLTVTAKDAGGNISKATKVTVKNSKK